MTEPMTEPTTTPEYFNNTAIASHLRGIAHSALQLAALYRPKPNGPSYEVAVVAKETEDVFFEAQERARASTFLQFRASAAGVVLRNADAQGDDVRLKAPFGRVRAWATEEIGDPQAERLFCDIARAALDLYVSALSAYSPGDKTSDVGKSITRARCGLEQLLSQVLEVQPYHPKRGAVA